MEPDVPQTGYAPVNGLMMYFEVHGAGGTPLLLLHGGLFNIDLQFGPLVQGFADTRQVIAVDFQGHGRTNDIDRPFSSAAFATDALAVLDHLGIERAHVVGQSMGGWCALGFAVTHPHRVLSLTLADTLGGISTPEIAELLIATARFEPPPDPPRAGVHPANEGLDQRNLALAVLYQQLASFGSAPDMTEMAGHLMATTWDLDAVAALPMPVLFVVGEWDQLFPPPVIEAAAALVPGAEYTVVPGAAHSPYFEQADAWNERVGGFWHRVG